MRVTLEHFRVDGAYGWNQDWFTDWFLRMGGCAAVTACDACVYFALRRGREKLYPYDPRQVTRTDYLRFSRMMKPYLSPRMRGIDRLDIYQEGVGAYARSVGETDLVVGALSGERSFAEAEAAVAAQIDGGYPVPFLLLQHQDPRLQFYVWHWFLLMGYDRSPESTLVQAVTYGSAHWLDFRRLWDTGFSERGGMILFSLGVPTA